MVLAHLVGDYLLQSGWMAEGKKKKWLPAVVHGLVYTIPFVVLTQSPWALLVIGGTHIIIDRYQLACHAVWVREQLAPRAGRPDRSVIADNYGSPREVSSGMAHAMKIVVDNSLHLLINAAALRWLA